MDIKDCERYPWARDIAKIDRDWMQMRDCSAAKGGLVNRCLMMMIVYLLPCGYASAQTSAPIISEMKQFYTIRKGDLLKAADRMPAEAYDFRPTPEVRTFAQLLGHIIDTQMGFCSAVKGEPRNINAGSKTAKVELVAALKVSFDECDSAFSLMTDVSASQMLKAGNGERSKLGTLLYATLHDNEEYGYLAMYLRLKGLVPPSTDSR
jgi:uncharacterized damage-inducible protein DinB